jgi:nicotinamidase-related amidase
MGAGSPAVSLSPLDRARGDPEPVEGSKREPAAGAQELPPTMRHPNLACGDDSFLVVIDMQQSFWNLVWEKERVLHSIELLLRCAQALGLPVLATAQNPSKVGGTMSAVGELLAAAPVVEKITFSCVAEPRFAQTVGALGRKTAILCGIETHVCIMETALDLVQAGYRVHVPADAVTSRGKINWRVALDNMRAAGVIITTVEALLFQLLRRAGTDEFRAVMGLIKSAALWEKS